MAAPIEIDVWQGGIAELEVDALVVGATESLFMNAGPAAAVARHGGVEIERAAVEQGPIAPGAAVATTAGSLAAGYVIHAVAVGHDRRADPDQLRSAVRSALAFVAPLQLRRVAFALLGTEHGAFDPPEAAGVLVATLHESATEPLETVVVATGNVAETRAVAAVLAAHRAGIR